MKNIEQDYRDDVQSMADSIMEYAKNNGYPDREPGDYTRQPKGKRHV